MQTVIDPFQYPVPDIPGNENTEDIPGQFSEISGVIHGN